MEIKFTQTAQIEIIKALQLHYRTEAENMAREDEFRPEEKRPVDFILRSKYIPPA